MAHFQCRATGSQWPSGGTVGKARGAPHLTPARSRDRSLCQQHSMGLEGCVCVCLCKFEGQENGGKFPGSDKRNGSLSLYPSSPITPPAFRGLGEGQWRPTRQEGVRFFSSLICLLPSQPRSLVIYSSGRGVEGRPPWRLLPERP